MDTPRRTKLIMKRSHSYPCSRCNRVYQMDHENHLLMLEEIKKCKKGEKISYICESCFNARNAIEKEKQKSVIH